MYITFGNVLDEKNKLNKTFIESFDLIGVLRDECSITNPVILVESQENLSFYNYLYISSFGRYYFITDIEVVRTKIWRITAKVDVLMSFRESINTCPVVLSNTQTTLSEKYMSGEMWKTLVKTKTDIINFPSGLNNNGEYILITSGG